MEIKSIQKIGGICAILEGLIYIVAFIIYGGVFVYPGTGATAAEEFNFLSNNYMTLSILNFTSYVLFGILLAVVVVAIHERLKKNAPNVSKLAFIFGVIWVGLVMASGMISNIGLHTIIGSADPEEAMQIWSSVSIVTEGLGGGNEIVGGLWVLLISCISLQEKLFSKPLIFLGMLVGIAGILTVYPLDIFTEIFGSTQIIWFVWIGAVMIRKPEVPVKN
ncbi:DUF4386 family protein [uncultured Dokdonia sp.]|uniref:DUF4386 family protein n=1 Tax=uncultured Dokdonia sp. TaxID=575653 RepID=UPI0026395FD0|nr:DUF4386 family protein [uncultured Dokdonia sp.]